MKYRLIVRIQRNEYWYGGYVADGAIMPFSGLGVKCINLKRSRSNSHSNKILLSSKGRYIYSDGGFKVIKIGASMIIVSDTPIVFEFGYGSLKGSYIESMRKHFPFTDRAPDMSLLDRPQYSTWMALGSKLTDDTLMEYAVSILKSGFGSGELIIDDGWQNDYGDWTFDKNKFKDAKFTIAELKKLGFKPVLWVVPFVSPDCRSFNYLRDKGALILDKKGNVAYRKWWNGRSAVLDMSSPAATAWLKNTLDELITEYGIDGFKFDAGDSFYYSPTDLVHVDGAVCDEQTRLYAEFAENYSINELRVTTRNGGAPIIARLADKSHMWNSVIGLRSLVPQVLACGIIGLPFVCPDMIGGGQILSSKSVDGYDKELVLRWMETSVLMPYMQFSIPFWKSSDKAFVDDLKSILEKRKEFVDVLKELYIHAATTGEPIVRYMEYEYPHCGLAEVNDQFLLGSDYIIAPVTDKKKTFRSVYLPVDTIWKSLLTDIEYYGGKPVEIKCEKEQLIIMKRIR